MSYETYISNLRMLHAQLAATNNPSTASRIRGYIARLERLMLDIPDTLPHPQDDIYA